MSIHFQHCLSHLVQSLCDILNEGNEPVGRERGLYTDFVSSMFQHVDVMNWHTEVKASKTVQTFPFTFVRRECFWVITP